MIEQQLIAEAVKDIEAGIGWSSANKVGNFEVSFTSFIFRLKVWSLNDSCL